MESQALKYCNQHKVPILFNMKNISEDGQCRLCIQDFLDNQQQEEEQKTLKEMIDISVKSIRNMNVQLSNLQKNTKTNSNIVDIKQKKIKYQLIEESTIRDLKEKKVFVFNNDSTSLFIAYNEQIKVFSFDQGKSLKQELQTLQGHSSQINCLYYIKKTNQLISGSLDKTIFIWTLTDSKISFSTLEDHKCSVNCLIMDQNEDTIISGSLDETVKFWKYNQKQYKWECIESLKTELNVFNLSLNSSEQKLILCGEDKSNTINYIKIAEKYAQKWNIVQVFELDNTVHRLCFINNDEFMYQSEKSNYLEIFKFSNDEKKFRKFNNVEMVSQKECNRYFTCQIVENLNIFLIKNGQYINIFGIQQNGRIELRDQIKFNTHRYKVV